MSGCALIAYFNLFPVMFSYVAPGAFSYRLFQYFISISIYTLFLGRVDNVVVDVVVNTMCLTGTKVRSPRSIDLTVYTSLHN